MSSQRHLLCLQDTRQRSLPGTRVPAQSVGACSPARACGQQAVRAEAGKAACHTPAPLARRSVGMKPCLHTGLTRGWGFPFLLVPKHAVVPSDSHYQGFCSAALHSDSSRLGHGQDGHELLLLVGLPDPAEELVGTETGETVTCLASLQKAPVQPSNPPFSSVAQELPRPGTPRRCPRLAPSLPRAAEMFPPTPGAEPPLGRMLSTAFPPKPARGELSLRRQSKGLLFQWCLRAQPPALRELCPSAPDPPPGSRGCTSLSRSGGVTG